MNDKSHLDTVHWSRLSHDLFERHIPQCQTTLLCALFDLDRADFVLPNHNHVSVHLSILHFLSAWGNVALLVTHFSKHFPERTSWSQPDLGWLSTNVRRRKNGKSHSTCDPRIWHHQLSNHRFCWCGQFFIFSFLKSSILNVFVDCYRKRLGKTPWILKAEGQFFRRHIYAFRFRIFPIIRMKIWTNIVKVVEGYKHIYNTNI